MSKTRVFFSRASSPKRANRLSSPRTGPSLKLAASTSGNAGRSAACARTTAASAASGTAPAFRAVRVRKTGRRAGAVRRRVAHGTSVAAMRPAGQRSATEEVSCGKVVAKAAAMAPPYVAIITCAGREGEERGGPWRRRRCMRRASRHAA
jgi:hypothetical protein